MAKKNLDRLRQRVCEAADILAVDEDNLGAEQLADQLRDSGIDPDALKRRFNERLREIATRTRTTGGLVPMALQQAIQQTAGDTGRAGSPAGETSWIERVTRTFALPDRLEMARAYRKSGELSEEDQAELDELEQKLKDEIEGKHSEED